MIICLDTNILLNELCLKSGLGSALRLYMKTNDVKLLLPEVIKLELINNLEIKINKEIDNIQKSYKRLLPIFGSLKEIVLPNDELIKSLTSNIFSSMGLEIIEVPYSYESSKSSFLKIINKEPPNGEKNQQFKDGVIWYDCISSLDKDEVLFITEDKAFYENRDYKKGLAINLKREIENKKNKFSIMSDISSILSVLDSKISISNEEVYEHFYSKNKNFIEKIVEDRFLEPINEVKLENKIFATEDNNIMFVKFKISKEYSASEEIVSLEANGSFEYDVNKTVIQNMKSNEIFFYKTSDNKKEILSRSVTAFPESLVLGHKSEIYKTQYLIDPT